MPTDRDPSFEQRLDALRQEALGNGRVAGAGVDVAGGPIPPAGMPGLGAAAGGKSDRKGKVHGAGDAAKSGAGKAGYFGMPVIKPPVWTWEIPVYFFVGGLTGMAAVIAAAAWFGHHPEVARAAMWLAFAGGIISPALLVMDLGRPLLFLNMLRVFKLKSAMSMGVYILSAFGTCAVPGGVAMELVHRDLLPPGLPTTLLRLVAILLMLGSAGSGLLLATYTGVLIGATAVPAWFTHRSMLPVHFGTAGMGSAAGMLELLGYRIAALNAISWAAIAVETSLWLWLMLRPHGKADRAIREGTSGWMLHTAELLSGPGALVLRAFHLVPFAAVVFMAGSLLSRLGWLAAGRASAADPEAVFASQR